MVLVLAVVVWWSTRSKPEVPQQSAGSGVTAAGEEGLPPQAVQQSDQSLGGSIYSQIQDVKNPADNIPNTSPLGEDTNPIKGAYKNPFGQ